MSREQPDDSSKPVVQIRKGDRLTFYATADRDHDGGAVIAAKIADSPHTYSLPATALATHDLTAFKVGDMVTIKDRYQPGKLLMVDGTEAVIKEAGRGLVIVDLADLRRV